MKKASEKSVKTMSFLEAQLNGLEESEKIESLASKSTKLKRLRVEEDAFKLLDLAEMKKIEEELDLL